MPSEKQDKPQPRVFQINISDGGVPKLAVRQAFITAAGVQGDRQRDLVHHGGPERAVCLYPLEHILALQAEGHPVFPGSVGENLTLSGLDWSQMIPGKRLQVGEQVVLEVTRYTQPCNNLHEFFLDGNFTRISQTQYPGWSRVYARVLRDGVVTTGDPVIFI